MELFNQGASKRMEFLVEELNRHRRLYYQDDAPEISDEQYDALFRELRELEENTGIVLGQSPTRQIGFAPAAQFSPYTHASRMLSLDNAFGEEEFVQFYRRLQKLLGTTEEIELLADLKYDGASVNTYWVNGKLVAAATRGDGTTGETVSQNFVALGIPTELKGPDIPDILEIRGEVYMPYSSFARVNQEREAAGLKLFRTPRNAASGSLRQLDVEEARKRGLKFVPYGVGVCEGFDFKTFSKLSQWFSSQGFDVPWTPRVVTTLQDAIEIGREIEALRLTLWHDIDGAVFKLNDLSLLEKCGATAKDPRWSIALKFPPPCATTVLQRVVPQVGRSGIICPVGEFSPVVLQGTLVSRATLHHYQWAREKDVRIGDSIVVSRRGEVIPGIVGPVLDSRPADAIPIEAPTYCPSCGASLVDEDGVAAIRCVNIDCEAQAVERIVHFASKRALNITGLGVKTVEALFAAGMVKHFSDVFTLGTGDLMKLPHFGKKAAENLIEAIEKSKHTTLARFLYALGIFHIGEQTAKLLSGHFNALTDICRATSEDFLRIPQIGEESAKSLSNFFNNPDNLKALNRIGILGIELTNPESEKATTSSKNLQGLTFVLTGTMDRPREEIKGMIEMAGAKVSGSVSRKTSYVVAGKDAGTKLADATRLGIQVIDYQGLLDILALGSRLEMHQQTPEGLLGEMSEKT